MYGAVIGGGQDSTEEANSPTSEDTEGAASSEMRHGLSLDSSSVSLGREYSDGREMGKISTAESRGSHRLHVYASSAATGVVLTNAGCATTSICGHNGTPRYRAMENAGLQAADSVRRHVQTFLLYCGRRVQVETRSDGDRCGDEVPPLCSIAGNPPIWSTKSVRWTVETSI
ncbi:hypothetical protein M427DRAFT_384257 [Gonapodya prolifera JEL478]|uniref:Uncharacterized protein n=1 Tax=Gonapodya prolifera (strain JEL478) TaxID=1344416 RepID=A0A139A8V6_GONPJ|nr:hypothetical protein M427DRAFT_384257 [Gonapodya prolifera JEL478]|eukprot:KXS13220.1 hypothetical protein M427DRAFT_384257 [Gonapodya prolifera JEL478]